MRIRDAKVYQLDGTFKTADILTEGVRIHSGAPADGEIVDAYDCYAIPGLVDINVVAVDGHKFAEADPYAFREMTRYLAGHGVTACAAVVPAFPDAHSKKLVEALGQYVKDEAPRRADSGDVAAVILEADRDVAAVREIATDADGLVKAVVVNANEDGAREFVKDASKDFIVGLSADETSQADAEVAFKDGATFVSHLWSEPFDAESANGGALAAALDRKTPVVELVADKLHEHADDIASFFTQFGGRIALTTNNGDFTLFDAMRHAIEAGVPANLAIDAATVVPARALGIEESYGTIQDGRYADIVLVDSKTFELKHVILHGQMIL